MDSLPLPLPDRLYRPSALMAFLHQYNKKPRKGLSQNFLIDGNIIRKTIQVAAPTADDHLIEIGPGPGGLTEMLLETGAKVLSIEKDPFYADQLKRLQTSDERLAVVEGDILQIALNSYLPTDQKSKVIANLPYHLTAPILALLLPQYEQISTLTLMVQDEVALRMVAKKGTKAYSSLTLLTQFWSDATYAFKVAPTCFYPRPKVNSAIVHLKLKPKALTLSGQQDFSHLTRSAFQQRRKMIKTALSCHYPSDSLIRAFQTTGLNPQSRAEEFSIDDYLLLATFLKAPTHPEAASHN